MELDEMKTMWVEMSEEIEKQKKLTDSLIIKMTEVNYRNKISKILMPEATGGLVCFLCFLFILINSQQLDTPYLLFCGIVSTLILLLMPVLSIKAIYKMRFVNILGNNYKQALSKHSKSKMQFVTVQKLSFYLGAILLLVVLPVMARLMGAKDPFKSNSLWYLYAVLYPFFYWFAKRVFKSYNKTAADAENILKELEV